MTGSRKNTETEESLVQRACVGMTLHDVRLLHRLQPEMWHFRVEHLRLGLFETSLVLIPSTTLDKQAIDVGTIFSSLSGTECRIIHDLVVPCNQINGNGVLPGEVLLETSEERLGEEETREPEGNGGSFFNPLLHEDKTFNHVHDVGSEWLHGWVGYFSP